MRLNDKVCVVTGGARGRSQRHIPPLSVSFIADLPDRGDHACSRPLRNAASPDLRIDASRCYSVRPRCEMPIRCTRKRRLASLHSARIEGHAQGVTLLNPVDDFLSAPAAVASHAFGVDAGSLHRIIPRAVQAKNLGLEPVIVPQDSGMIEGETVRFPAQDGFENPFPASSRMSSPG